MKKLVIALMMSVMAAMAMSTEKYVTVSDSGRLQIGDSTYRFVGTNLWYAPMLASEGEGGDSARLHRELDSLQAMGVNNLRILAGAEGPEGLRYHISPVLQTRPGEYNDTLLRGLDYLLAEMERRDMKAVIYLTNAWEWSGGYGSLLQWTGHGEAPVPGLDGYKEYVDHVAQFVFDDSARQIAVNHARFMASRVNTLTGKPYAESPAIMAWQVCNEPRAFSKAGKEALAGWIRDMAAALKEVDGSHLVSTGSEGKYGCESDLELWTRIHAMPEIDYAIIHLWPTNWGWASRDSVEAHVGWACEYSDEYINEHLDALAKAGVRKPLVIEEFGYPRDGMKFGDDVSVTARDVYYKYLFDRFLRDDRIAGVNFWGWNGTERPRHEYWQKGDPYMCDPAHEPQGFYGVYDSDRTTVDLIRKAAGRL